MIKSQKPALRRAVACPKCREHQAKPVSREGVIHAFVCRRCGMTWGFTTPQPGIRLSHRRHVIC